MLALVGGTVYEDPDHDPYEDAIVLIDGDAIVNVGIATSADAQRIDCSGLKIVAGFWNSHVHFFERKWADAANIPDDEVKQQMVDTFSRYGFTTVFDLGSPLANTLTLRERTDVVRIFTTGHGLIPPNALPPESVLAVMGVMNFPMAEVSEGIGASDAVRKLLADGADGIKAFASSPRGAMSKFAMRPACVVAQAAHKPFFVHPNSNDDIALAVECGATVIAHTTPRSPVWEDTLVWSMVERNVALTPTLSLWEHYARHDRLSTQQRIVDTALAQLRAFRLAGGTVLFGTDLGAVDPDPTPELALMRRSGMRFPDILRSLTTNPSTRFTGRPPRVRAGEPADVVVMRDFDDVVMTIRAGKITYAES